MAKEDIYKITGQVQGVSFRAGAKKIADQLGITGYADNEPDGSLLIVAQGNEKSLEKFEKWCWRGSTYARVDNIEKETRPAKSAFTEFKIIY